jgi:hypothetical protein
MMNKVVGAFILGFLDDPGPHGVTSLSMVRDQERFP